MSQSTKKVLLTIAAVIVGLYVLKVVVGFALALVFQFLVPALVIGAIGFGAYYLLNNKKSLGSGNRKILP